MLHIDGRQVARRYRNAAEQTPILGLFRPISVLYLAGKKKKIRKVFQFALKVHHCCSLGRSAPAIPVLIFVVLVFVVTTTLWHKEWSLDERPKHAEICSRAQKKRTSFSEMYYTSHEVCYHFPP